MVQSLIKTKTKQNSSSGKYFIYFESSKDMNDGLVFIPHTGPSNTLHLDKQLYLPQLSMKNQMDSTTIRQQFLIDYNEICKDVKVSSEVSLGIYIRFGMMYLIQNKNPVPQCFTLKDFVDSRNRSL